MTIPPAILWAVLGAAAYALLLCIMGLIISRFRCVARGCADDGRLPIARTEDDAAEIHDDPVLPALTRSKAWQ